MKNKKRFQECNKLQKLWRYRWYLTIPFIYVWHYIKPLKVGMDELVDDKLVHTDKYFVLRGKELWKTIKSTRQGKMEWYYTMEEVKENMKKKYGDKFK